MAGPDPTAEFGRILKQVKAQEYERGWREAMEAIQRAANDLIEHSSIASLAAAVSDDAADASSRSKRTH